MTVLLVDKNGLVFNRINASLAEAQVFCVDGVTAYEGSDEPDSPGPGWTHDGEDFIEPVAEPVAEIKLTGQEVLAECQAALAAWDRVTRISDQQVRMVCKVALSGWDGVGDVDADLETTLAKLG